MPIAAAAGDDSRQGADRFEYATTDPEAAKDFLGRLFGPHEPQISGSAENFRFRVTSVSLDGFRIQSLEHTMRVRTTVVPSGSVAVAHLLSGGLEISHRDRDTVVQRGESHLVQAHADVEAAWEDVRVGLVRFNLGEIETIAAEQWQVDPASLRFLQSRPVSPEAERYWQATVRFVNREVLPNPYAVASPIVQGSVGRLLGIALLHAFPNTATSGDYAVAPTETVPPAALRRAVDFIQSHAGEPITMSDIAAAARVTPRSLQHGFRRLWNTTPTAYLRSVRLERAHRELQAADPSRGDTVAAVAARWGFGNVGRFAARYRERYGHAPHEVLRT